MNRFPAVLMLLVVSLLMGACVPSLHPLYTEKELVFEPALVGGWTTEDADETWHFAKEGEKAYILVQTDKDGRTGRFKAHLLELGNDRYLDLFPEELDWEANDFYKWHLVGAHTFLKIGQIGAVLQMAMTSPDWFDKLLKAIPTALRHERIEDRLVLTASTAKLQAFFLKHAGDEKLFPDLAELKRMGQGENQPPDGTWHPVAGDVGGAPGETPTHAKITFDLGQIDEHGLRGPPDGKVAAAYEFCIPDTAENRAEVKAIDGTVEFVPGSRGRIGCGDGQCLCIGSTGQVDCRAVLQRLAGLPYVERIDECFFE